jgi:anti-sigma B factor antagonist
MATPLEITSRVEGDQTALLSLAGELDVSNVAEAREAARKLLDDGSSRLVVDLAQVTYTDSSGLGMLVGLLKRLRESGGAMAIAAPVPRVRRVFEITGLTQIFTLCDDVAAALKEVRG